MELNLCPQCGAFIRQAWQECQACNAPLSSAETEKASAEEPREDSNEAPEEITPKEITAEEVTAEPITYEKIETGPDSYIEVPRFNSREEAFKPSPSEFHPVRESVAQEAAADLETPTDEDEAIAFSALRIHSEAPKPNKGGKLAIGIAAAGAIGICAIVGGITLPGSAPKSMQASVPATSAISGENHDNPWIEFREETGLFVASVPTPPRVIEADASLRLISEVAGSQSITFISAERLSADRAKALDAQRMQDQLERIAKEHGASVESSSFETNDDLRKLSGHFANDDSSLNGDAQFFVVDDVLYGLWLTSPNPTGDPSVFSRLSEGLHPKAAS